MTSDPWPPYRGTMLQGFLIAAGWNALGIGASFALMAAVIWIGIFLVAGFGLLQFAWLIPLWLHYRSQGNTESAKGVLVAAGITVLLSAACWANLSNMNIH